MKNAALLTLQPGIEGTLMGVRMWNVPLWTLPYEFAAYVVIGVLLSVAVVRKRPTLVLGALSMLAIVAQFLMRDMVWVESAVLLNALQLGSYFLLGALMFIISD
ncbi:hypothetical protein [Pseudoclavibacter terrae]|uniref:hypothetical protein n=1 Tax=Pseudoclavibacter terrae TaxID=1530195 RepID=UPI00142F1111|nr:hypothetical protein [Pseudoclavibacter terrae]